MFNIDFKELDRARKEIYPLYLGNFADLYDSVDFDDLATNLMMVNQNNMNFRTTPNMQEVHRVHEEDWCPPFLFDVTNYLQRSLNDRKIECICFVGEDAGHGYPWHIDGFDIFVGNVTGASTWIFEDKKQLIQPYDLMFVPMGVPHTVVGHSERVSFAVGNNTHQGREEEYTRIKNAWIKRAPHLNGSKIIPEYVDNQ